MSEERLERLRELARILTADETTLRIEVDGIVSETDAFAWVVAPIFDLRPDHHPERVISPSCRQMWNRPPTDAELDWWVRCADEEWDFLPDCGPIPSPPSRSHT